MNVKPGDLARVVLPNPAVGHICTIVRGPLRHPFTGALGWVVDPPIIRDGRPHECITDETLRRIDNPGDDEVDSRDVLVTKELEKA